MNRQSFLSRAGELIRGLYNGLYFSNRFEITYNRLFRRNAPIGLYIWKRRFFFISDCSVGDHISLGEVFPQREYDDLLNQCALTGKAIRYVNIGANIGAFDVKLMERDLEIEYGLAVELNPYTYERCLLNLRSNGLHQTRVLNAGVAVADGVIGFSPATCSLADNIFDCGSRASEHTTTVVLVSLTNLLATHAGEMSELDLLKMDCEGAEYGIIRATPTATLRRFRNVLVEFHGEPEGESLTAAYSRLSDAGFSSLSAAPTELPRLELFKRH